MIRIKPMYYNAVAPFYGHYLSSPESLALSVNNQEYSYRALGQHAQKISQWLQKSLGRRPARVGILATRSLEACAAIIGIGWAGGTYVPLSLKMPEDRLHTVLAQSELDALIVDPQGLALLTPALRASCPAYILAPDDIAALPLQEHAPVDVKPEDLAYIIFTSGSTGVPKGVMISAAALRHYSKTMQDLYQITPTDRVSETADISFDLSVGNMFMTWQSGASLHVVPASQMLSPINFIREHVLTIWFSVPSIISLTRQLRQLKPGIFPSLRYSLFIGEPLPNVCAHDWQLAAPNSIVENLYGPTEATVACTRYLIKSATQGHETVSIGKAFDGTELAIVDEELRLQPANTKGELALAGIQLATGYYKDPQKTEARFPVINSKRWYLTGDAAIYDADGVYHHLGRIDNQVKVLGYRVELEDIEAHLREVSGSELVAAVAWPISNGMASGIVGYVSKPIETPERTRELLRERLPTYMVPSTIHVISEFPLTANGKADRKALLAMLEEKKARIA